MIAVSENAGRRGACVDRETGLFRGAVSENGGRGGAFVGRDGRFFRLAVSPDGGADGQGGGWSSVSIFAS